MVTASLAQTGVDDTDAPVPNLVRLKLRAGVPPTSEGVHALLNRRLPGHRITRIDPWIRPELLAVRSDELLRKPTAESAYRYPLLSGLRRIVVVEFADGDDIIPLAEEIGAIPEVEYAEPVWRHHLSLLPNDQLLNEQSYVEQLHLSGAWEIAQGNAAVVIAVIDSGIDPLHPDLADAIWRNPGESGIDHTGTDRRFNGVDDDANGLIDDWWGYDFAGRDGYDEDNAPNATFPHGVHVAGIAAATGNNGEGVAGVGFGAGIMPLKVTPDTSTVDPDLIRPFEAILYAGRMGAHVINCSWGGRHNSRAEQEVIDAVTEMGSLVVAAAGNQGRGIAAYPAAYRHVISVGSVNSDDRRSAFSNYHESIDIVAPGENVLSTIPVEQGSYGRLSGTSMAAPMVSGAAALILSKHGPNILTPQQLGAILKSSADAVDDANPQFRTLLGAGRLNVERCMALGLSAFYAEVTGHRASDAGGDGYLDAGEEFDLGLTLHNILSAGRNVDVIAAVSDGGPLEPIRSVLSFPSLSSGEIVEAAANPLRFRIQPGTPFDQTAPVELTVLKEGRIVSTNRFEIVVNPSYGTTSTGRLAATFGGDGRIGYIDFPANVHGDGFRLDGSASLLAEGGLIVGTGPDRIASVVRNSDDRNRSAVLHTLSPFRVRRDGVEDLEIGTATMTGTDGSSTGVGVEVSLETRAYATRDRENRILMLYTIRNVSGGALNDLHCALFLDWDLGLRGRENRTILDPTYRMAYTEHATDRGYPVAGAMHVSDDLMNFTALDNLLAPLSDGFTPDEKWRAISQGIGNVRSNVGDNAMVIGAGPISLAMGDSTVVAFALLTGADPDELRAGAEEMRALYRELGGTPGGPVTVIGETAFLPVRPNPFHAETLISYGVPEEKNVRLDIFDLEGRHVARLVDERQRQGIHEVRFAPPWTAGPACWVARLHVDGKIYAEKLIYLGD